MRIIYFPRALEGFLKKKEAILKFKKMSTYSEFPSLISVKELLNSNLLKNQTINQTK